MSAANTFSPDSTLAGPVVQVLRGCIDQTLRGPDQLEKGEPLYYTKNRSTGKAMFTKTAPTTKPTDDNNPVKYVILAEAVVIHKSDFEISVPVVVSGAAQVRIRGNDRPALAGKAFMLGTAPGTGFSARLTHEEYLPSQERAYDVFVETF